MAMLKSIGIGAAVLVGGVLIAAAMRPDTFRVQRSADIKAAPETIFPLINDLHRFNGWNPFERKDPNLKRSYSGPESGKGAAYAFDGDSNVGKGSLEILDSAQGAVPYFAKIIHLFIDMDRMVGTQFEAGLASHKAIAEKSQ
jgi:hypothetical protein